MKTLLVLLLLPAIAFAAEPRPNIIFVLTDDQRYDEMGFLNPILATPNMDAIAAEGVHFANAFVTTSLCSPSRASVLTGQMMHNHGVVDNNRPLPPGLELFPARLRSAGYQTAFVGKWHMGGAISEPRDEFDYWVSFPGQGSYYPRSFAGGVSQLNVNGQIVPQSGYITDELTDYALEFLSGRDRDRPFFLYLSHKAVHAMFEPAKRHREQYAQAEIRLGAANTDPDADVPMWVQNQRNSWHGDEFPYHSDLPLADFKRAYHQTLTAVDDSLGRLRAWLSENGLADNTIVMLMGDNGFLFGEHGLIDKRNAYEESMRVPLIAVGPGMSQGLVVDDMVANIDIAPTILTWAGVAAPSHYDGASFAHLATGQDDPNWRDALVYEYYWEFNYPQTPTTFALRTARYKYVQYHGVWDTEELFDLVEDPTESRNLIEDEAHAAVKVELRGRLYAALADREGGHAIPYSVRFNQGATFRHADRSQAAEFPNKWSRKGDAPDRLEHVIPDGPEKAERLKALNKALED
ncbi:MAG: sulfatase [Pseudomonadales bacterium]